MGDDDLEDQLDDLSTHIDTLEKLLEPITGAPITEAAQNLPILDQAKLNVLTAYAANSLIFAALKLEGQDPREHPVWEELARTRTYFEKIKAAEDKGAAPAPEQHRPRLDVAAAGRFIKAGLSGNDRVGNEAKSGAKRKLDALGAILNSSNANSGDDDEGDAPAKAPSKKARKKARRAQRLADAAMGSDPEPSEPAEPAEPPVEDNALPQTDEAVEARTDKSQKKKDKKDKKDKKGKRSDKAPRDSKEVMKDLLKKGGEKKKKKRSDD